MGGGASKNGAGPGPDPISREQKGGDSMKSSIGNTRISRRDLLKAAAADAPELTFVNGRIHTMDDDNRVVSSVAIRGGRFVSLDNASNPGPGSKVVNLHGRTA